MRTTQYTDQWITALRDGSYTQAHGALQVFASTQQPDIKPGHCCLGVAADLMGKLIDGVVRDTGGCPNACELWSEQYELLGITEDEMNALAEFNDEGGTFAQIADALEAAKKTGTITLPELENEGDEG